MVRRSWAQVLLICLLFVIGCAGPRSNGQSQGTTPKGGVQKPGGELVVGLDLEPDNLDPHVTPFAVSHTVMMNMFDTLVWRAKDGKFVAGLAEKWEAGADGKVYTFILRTGVSFHDGTPLNAEAVKFSLDRIADPDTHSGFAANLLGPYDHAEIVDDHTVKVFFKTPFAAFLDGASQAFLGIVSPTAVKKLGKDFGRHPVGSGFMKFGEWVDKDHITFIRNPDYKWAPPIFDHEGPAFLEKITFRFFTDGPTRLAALESGDAQLIERVPDHELSRVESKYHLNRAISLGLPIVEFLNSTKAPTDDLAVRQALNYGINRQTLADVGMFGATKPALGPLSDKTPYYSQKVEPMYPFNLQKAKELLDQAGWKAGTDGLRAQNGQKLSISWAITPFDAGWAELVQAQLREAGVDVQITSMTTSAAFEGMTRGDFNMVTLGWNSSDPVVLSNLFHSKNIKAGFAWSKYNDAHLDELLDAGEKTMNESERTRIYADIQQIVMGKALIMPLAGVSQNTAYQKKYQGVKWDYRNYLWLYDTSISG